MCFLPFMFIMFFLSFGTYLDPRIPYFRPSWERFEVGTQKKLDSQRSKTTLLKIVLHYYSYKIIMLKYKHNDYTYVPSKP